MENPTYENVEILKTAKNIKVTFGNKVYNYSIISEKQFSSVKMDYTVTLNNNTYELSICKFSNGTYGVVIDGIFTVNDITDVKTIDVK